MRKWHFMNILLTLSLSLLTQLGWAGGKDDSRIGKRSVANHSLISEEKEEAIGKHYAMQFDRSAKLLTDPIIKEYISRVAQNIARNSDLRVPLTVKIIDSTEIRIFTIPRGFLYVSAGLISHLEQEGELAGALAHEIAHLAAHHWASMMTKSTVTQYAMMPLIFVPADDPVPTPKPQNPDLTPVSFPVPTGVPQNPDLNIPLALLKWSRECEEEADYLGMQYMYTAGYDPNSYLTFLHKIAHEETRGMGQIPEALAARPPAANRLINSEKEIKIVLPARGQSVVTTSEFDDVKARLQSLVTSLREGN